MEAYLISNYRMKAFNSRWRCPTCSFELRPARCVQAKRADCPTRRPRDLIVDSFVQTLLAQTAEETEEDTRGLILPLQSLSTSAQLQREIVAVTLLYTLPGLGST